MKRVRESVEAEKKKRWERTQSTSTCRGWTHKEASTGEALTVPEGGVKQTGSAFWKLRKESVAGRKEVHGVSEKSVEVGLRCC